MAAAKFVFTREFPAAPNRILPLETKEPTLTLSEHQRIAAAAVAGARAEAFVEGRLEGEASAAARLAEIMEAIDRRLDAVGADLAAVEEAATAEAIRFAHGFARKLAGRLLDAAPMAEIEAAARAVFDDLRGQPHVAVRVAPGLVEAAKERLTAIGRERGFEGRLIVIGEPEIAAGDVRIEWADGGILRDRAGAEAAERAIAAGGVRAAATHDAEPGAETSGA
jgi:flagellar assembly protein FliH